MSCVIPGAGALFLSDFLPATSSYHLARREITRLTPSSAEFLDSIRQCLRSKTMATNGVTNRKGEDDGMIHVTDTHQDNLGGNLSHVKTGMTISPELFEKV